MVDAKVKLLCVDNEEVQVEVSIAEKSVLIKGFIDHSGTDEQILLPNINRAILEKVMEFCKYIVDHREPEIEKPLRSTDMFKVVEPWYATYINVEQEMLFELIMASNYLEIKSLLELSCAKSASMIKNKSIPEIRKFFNIVNDYTPEEEAQIIEDNKWAEQTF